MKTHVSATFVDGVIMPDESLNLPNHARVHVTVELAQEPKPADEAWVALQRRLAARPIHASGQHFTRDELHERD